MWHLIIVFQKERQFSFNWFSLIYSLKTKEIFMKWLKHTFRCIYIWTNTVYNQNEHELHGDGRHFNKKNFVNDTESTEEIHFPCFMFAKKMYLIFFLAWSNEKNTFVVFSVSLCTILGRIFKKASNKIRFRKYTNEKTDCHWFL